MLIRVQKYKIETLEKGKFYLILLDLYHVNIAFFDVCKRLKNKHMLISLHVLSCNGIRL